MYSFGNHTVTIDSTVIQQSSGIQLGGQNSRISRSRVDSTYGIPAVLLSGNNAIMESTLIRTSPWGAGVWLGGTARILSCEVRDSGGDGIIVLSGNEVHNCNLVNNAGDGVSSWYGTPVDAENNWWGDAAGPTGTNGDGVGSGVSYTPWRTTPYVLPYVP